MRQASYACGKTARQKHLTVIHAAEAVGLDGVEEMTKCLNEMCDEEVEKNVSDDEKEEGEDDSGGRAVPPPYAELSSHFCALESVAEKCGMKKADHHLQKAKMAMIDAHASTPARHADIRALANVTEKDDGERGGSGSGS